MWSGRGDLMGMADALAVPETVREALGAACPPHEFTLYRVDSTTVCAVSNLDDVPYEVYVSHRTALEHPDIVRALASSRREAHEALVTSAGTDAGLPVCRTVYARGEDGSTALARDVVVAPGQDAPRFPFYAAAFKCVWPYVTQPLDTPGVGLITFEKSV